MIDKRPAIHLRPAAMVAMMFLSAMTVTMLAGSGVGAVHANGSLCSFTCMSQARAAARVDGSPITQPAAGETLCAAGEPSNVETPSTAANWKILDLPPPAR